MRSWPSAPSPAIQRCRRALAAEHLDLPVGAEEHRLVVEVAAQGDDLARARRDPDGIDADLLPEPGGPLVVDLLRVVLVVGDGVGDREVVGRLVVGDHDLLLGRGERGAVDVRGVDHVVDRVDDVVPALGDRLDELAPQPRAFAPDERQRALVQQAEAGCGVQHLGDGVELAHVGDGAHDVDDLGQLADRPRVGVLRRDLRHPDDVVALGLLGGQLGDRQIGHQRPRGVVDQVVFGGGAHERGELGDLGEREERVVVTEEGLPFLAVLTPLRRPQRDEIAFGERKLDGDDVAGHGRSVTVWPDKGVSARRDARPS